MMHGWSLLLACVVVGCASAPRPFDPGEVPHFGPRASTRSELTTTVRLVFSSTHEVDAFEKLLVAAGLEDPGARPRHGRALSPSEAARLLALLMNRPVTLASFPPRMVAGHLLREVQEGGEVSRQELLRRLERFASVAVLRPDGYLAWARTGRTQQRVGPVQWKEQSFRAGPFELGRFYSGRSGVFRLLDHRLREADGEPLADVYDDADYLGRTLDGAEESFVELALAIGQLLSAPADSLAALRHLPAGLVALVVSSPEYLERFKHMTRGEQVKALSKLTISLIATWGTAAATTRTLRSAMAAAEVPVTVLSLSAQGALVMERVAAPVGRAAAVLGGGPGAAIILQRASTSANGTTPPGGPGRWGPANEAMPPRSRRYQEQISGHSADEAYWVGGMDTKSGGVKVDGSDAGVLLEAKGPGYANKFLDDLEPQAWFEKSGAQELVTQARRQLRAAEGTRIRWHVAEKKTAEAIQSLFERNGVAGIDVVFTPPVP